MPSIGFISLGCSKNLVDSQIMAGVLLGEKLTLAPSPDAADVILINTCAFIDSAREEAAENILSACAHKAEGGCKAVVVAGCMPQRYRERLAEAFPEVDAFLGVDELDAIGEVIRQALKKQSPGAVRVREGLPVRTFNPPSPLRFTGQAFAYLKIAEGCNHVCAFCSIPSFRGRYRSRAVADIVTEAKSLIATGAREINLIAQDVTSYGRDKKGHPALADLLRELDGLDGDFRLRLLYGYPSRVTDDLLTVMRESRHVDRYLDLPIQHAHPDMIRAMRRADTLSVIPDLPRRLREAVPGITLRTTCLVGFPGETEDHFKYLLDAVEAARFDHLGAFAYCPEEGTIGAELPDLPDEEVAQDRLDRLMKLQKKIARDLNKARIGQRGRALVLGFDEDDTAHLRLEHQAPEVDGETLLKNAPDSINAGDFIEVEISGVVGYDLIARLP